MSAVAAVLLMAGAGAGAAPPGTPVVEHFPAPAINGRPAPFAHAVRVGDTLYLSGRIGDVDGKLDPGFEAQARQAMENIGAVLKARGLSYADLVKCTVMLADMKDWPAFNAIYIPYFPPGRLPARSALGANGLALGALVEVECLAYAGSR